MKLKTKLAELSKNIFIFTMWEILDSLNVRNILTNMS